MPDSYNINKTDGTLDFVLEPMTIDVEHGLTFTGRRRLDYGEHRNENILKLAENFASEEDAGNPGNPPTTVIANPLEGQLWRDKTNSRLKMWDGGSWVTLLTSASLDVDANEVDFDDSTVSFTASDVQAALEVFDDHLTETNGAHAASAISFDDNPVGFTASNVQNAIEYLESAINSLIASDIIFGDGTVSFTANNVQDAIEALDTDIQNHINDTTDAHDASAISFVDGSVSFTASEVQTAIEALDTDIQNHINDTTDAHDASAISFDDSSVSFTANDVQEAIEDLESQVTSGSVQETAAFSLPNNTSVQTISHGGANPKIAQLVLICTSAVDGYSVSDELVINPSMNEREAEGPDSLEGFNMITWDSSNFYFMRYADASGSGESVFNIADRAGANGLEENTPVTSWNYRIRWIE